MKNNIDYSIYLVTDQTLMSTKTLIEAVELAILGGCTVVQLREKNISSLEFFKLAKELKMLTSKHNIPLIINDRIDIALAVNADGVHIGQSDIPTLETRKIIGEHMLLGVSVRTLQEAQKAVCDGADYLGVGAMYATSTKDNAELVCLEQLDLIREKIQIPMVVIGGINLENAPIFAQKGVDGLAIVSAIISQKDIKKATADLKDIFQKAAMQ